MDTTVKILFVDDEPNVLQGIRRMLRGMRHEWHMVFVTSGREALQRLAEESFDIVISDMRMPEMDGAQLLAEIKRLYPQIVRIVLSGYSDREMTIRSVNSAHQYLAKPCESDALRVTVGRATKLRAMLECPKLRELVMRIDTLPSPPSVYEQLNEQLDDKRAGMREVAAIVHRDAALTANLLKLVNSSFFGIGRNITSVEEAVTLLGIDLLKSLIASIHLRDWSGVHSPHLTPLWHHSLRTAVAAKAIVACEHGDHKSKEIAFTAGLLHDIGKLILLQGFGDRYLQLLDQAGSSMQELIELERATFGATHADVAAYLLALWGLPHMLVEAVAYHHDPSRCVHPAFGPLTAVHVANVLDHKELSEIATPAGAPLDKQYLNTIQPEDHLPLWREACIEALNSGVAA